MRFAVKVKVGDLVGVRRFRPVVLRSHDGLGSIGFDGHRHDDHRDVRPSRVRAERFQKVPAIHHRHSQIEEDETRQGLLLRKPMERFSTVVGLEMCMPLRLDQLGQGFAGVCVILDDEYGAHGMLQNGSPASSDPWSV